MSTSTRITILVTVIGIGPLTVETNPANPLGWIDQIIPCGSHVFIYENSIIPAGQTFEGVNIQNGSQIFVFYTNQNKTKKSQRYQMCRLKAEEEFSRIMGYGRLSQEAARLKDLVRSKIDGSVYYTRVLNQNYLRNNAETSETSTEPRLNIEYEVTSISTENLPKIW